MCVHEFMIFRGFNPRVTLSASRLAGSRSPSVREILARPYRLKTERLPVAVLSKHRGITVEQGLPVWDSSPHRPVSQWNKDSRFGIPVLIADDWEFGLRLAR